MDRKRGSGVLLHITSLPSEYGIGDLGPGAYSFADFLAETRQSYWQILPLNPTISACGYSPYSSISAFAGNPMFISPKILLDEGLLKEADLSSQPEFPQERCDYNQVTVYKEKILNRVYEHFKIKSLQRDEFNNFCKDQAFWLDDYALFKVIRNSNNKIAWNVWDKPLRDRSQKELDKIKILHEADIEKEKFFQFLFFKQWFSLKNYCNQRNIGLIGDIPIYVNYDSVDVWKNTSIFKLDKEKEPAFVAGVPPDYFSSTGQLWGNPVYDWDALKKSDYKWWVSRLKHNLCFFDILRIDHFRGLVSFWQVPGTEETAVNGQWKKVPTKDFFSVLFKNIKEVAIIAEDLGLITDDVRIALKRLGFPGMKVLHFAFADNNSMHPYLPHTYIENCVVYTGTHDNNTSLGWFRKDASENEKIKLVKYIGRENENVDVSWALIRLAMASVASMALFPLQDILNLDESSRMNIPSTPQGNWAWRFKPEQLTEQVRNKLKELTEIYGRAS
ncbi:MAG: 4-alpha-glucanotransferase [Candidatus Omnitrophica bacterium]|nr:4-alpha-glucanotransferase [Candidatus Omnitrophota bacterium]